jgi:ATP-dependent DNA ligase
VQLYAFDMLAGDGEDHRKLPLIERKMNNRVRVRFIGQRISIARRARLWITENPPLKKHPARSGEV